MQTRNTRFTGFVGAPGSGKSTYTAEALKAYPYNVIVWKHIVNIDDKAFAFLPLKTMETYKGGKCRMAGTEEDYKLFLEWVKNNFRNGFLLVDDATLVEENVLTKQMKHLVTMRRHYGIDIGLVYHGFSGFPIDQYKFLNWLVIFNTTDEIGYKRTKIPQFSKIMAASEIVKKRFSSLAKTDPNRYKPETVMLYN